MDHPGRTLPVKIVSIFVVLLLPIYVLLFLSAKSYIHSLETQVQQNTKAILDLHTNQLSNEMSRINQIIHKITADNPDFYRLLQWEETDHDILSLMKINSYLFEQNGLNTYKEAFFLNLPLDNNQYFLFVNRQVSDFSSISLRAALKGSQFSHTPLAWETIEIDGKDYLAQVVDSSGIYLGALIDLDAVMAQIQAALPTDGSQVRMEPFEESDQLLTVESTLKHTSHHFYVAIHPQSVSSAMPVIARAILIAGALTALVVPVLLLFLFIRMIALPLRQIELGIIRFGNGDPSYRIPKMKASREFISLRESFNTMAEEIHSLKIQQYEEQLEKKQMRLQNVLLQIRPHFLLNFFNHIYNLAELQEYEDIKGSCIYLSKFFRYLFRSERIATYRSELELVDSYLQLMGTRYMDCFTVERDIDESLLSYRIPPLIVQNFVENIFKYAVSDINFIHIKLTLAKSGDWVEMAIEDDGPGMDEDILRQIQEGHPIEKNDGTHIGIYNSLYRLKTLCGEDCRLEVQSVLTEGTCVRILLPYKGKGNK